MISRENMARVIEHMSSTPLLRGLLGDVSEDLERMHSHLLSMLSGVSPDRNSHENSYTKLKQTLDILINSTNDFIALFAEVEISNIEDIRTKVFPRMVEYHIIQLLKVSDPTDIPRVNNTLAQLSEKGVSVVWEKILPSLRVQMRQLCGRLFTEEYIQAGKTLPLDMVYLSSLVSPASIAKKALPVVIPGATAAAAPNTYMGMRRGFLSSPPKPAQKPRDQDAGIVTPSAENTEHNSSSVAP